MAIKSLSVSLTPDAGGQTGCPKLQALRLLAYLRVLSPLTQGLTLYLVSTWYDVQVHTAGVGAVLALEVLAAALTWWRLQGEPAIGDAELLVQAQLEMLLYGAMLYFTGGTTNPFGPLLALPMIIVSSALRPSSVWFLALVSIVMYIVLRTHHVALDHPHGHTQVYELHEDGMVVNYLITAVLLAFFVNRIHQTQRRNNRLLADAREAQVRNESAAAIGALAAGHAHELGSPLNTIAIVVGELRRQCPADSPTSQDLELLAEQLAECKRIVSKLSDAGGERRAETATAAPLDRFLNMIIARARALHPGATIDASLDQAATIPAIVAETTLSQAILDLICHAARVSPDLVQVRCRWTEDELRVDVADRGPGFPAEWLARLERQEVPPVTGDGSDLDLLRSAATLARVGGRLEAVNEKPMGARTTLRIPLDNIRVHHPLPTADGRSAF
jgi:two-component system sensor histidine kinase RegB